MWRHWTYKLLFRYILSSVWVRLSIFSQLSIIQYMGLCVFSLPISTVMIERIYTLSYYHHQIGSMNYYPLFRVRSWNNGMRCMFLYILMGYHQQYIGLPNTGMVAFNCSYEWHLLLSFGIPVSVYNFLQNIAIQFAIWLPVIVTKLYLSVLMLSGVLVSQDR